MSSFKATNPNSGKIKFETDTVAIIETNVDDVTGEILARTIEQLMSAGAYDATASPYLGKKGRMGSTVRVVCARDSFEKFAEILVEETGTLGAKVTEWTRLIVPRRQMSVPLEIEGFNGNISVKVARVNGRIRIKPELSDARRVSEACGLPLREVLEMITSRAMSYASQKKSEEAGKQEVKESD